MSTFTLNTVFSVLKEYQESHPNYTFFIHGGAAAYLYIYEFLGQSIPLFDIDFQVISTGNGHDAKESLRLLDELLEFLRSHCDNVDYKSNSMSDAYIGYVDLNINNEVVKLNFFFNQLDLKELRDIKIVKLDAKRMPGASGINLISINELYKGTEVTLPLLIGDVAYLEEGEKREFINKISRYEERLPLLKRIIDDYRQ